MKVIDLIYTYVYFFYKKRHDNDVAFLSATSVVTLIFLFYIIQIEWLLQHFNILHTDILNREYILCLVVIMGGLLRLYFKKNVKISGTRNDELKLYTNSNKIAAIILVVLLLLLMVMSIAEATIRNNG